MAVSLVNLYNDQLGNPAVPEKVKKAREEQGRAQYGAARELARQSLTYAQQAIERAGEKGVRPASATSPSADQSPDQPGPPTSRNP